MCGNLAQLGELSLGGGGGQEGVIDAAKHLLGRGVWGSCVHERFLQRQNRGNHGGEMPTTSDSKGDLGSSTSPGSLRPRIPGESGENGRWIGLGAPSVTTIEDEVNRLEQALLDLEHCLATSVALTHCPTPARETALVRDLGRVARGRGFVTAAISLADCPDPKSVVQGQ